MKSPTSIGSLLTLRLRTQITAFGVFSVIACAIGFYFYAIRQQQAFSAQEFAKTTQATLEAVRLGLEVGLQEENYHNVSTVLSWAKTNKDLQFMILTDKTGEVIAAYPEDHLALSGQTLQTFLTSAENNDHLVRSSPWKSPFASGHLYLGFSKSTLTEVKRRSIRDLGVITATFVLLWIVIAYLVAKRITHPLEHLRTTASRISDEGFKARADEQRGSVEVQAVARAFNAMLDQLAGTQSLMVQSEKMAALGQLIAGISHEINTPAGAIYSGVQEIERDHLAMLQGLLKLGRNLSESTLERYLAIAHIVIDAPKHLSTREQRQLAKDINLALLSLPNPPTASDDLAKKLALCALNKEHIPLFADLWSSEHVGDIVANLALLAGAQIQVHDMRIAISRIVHIVKALKHYSHMDSDPFVATNLADDIENTLILLQNKLKQGIVLEKHFAELPTLRCLADQLNQVWTNLIGNAIQAMGGQGKLILRLFAQDGEVKVEVEDSGPGIPPDVLPRIFTPYFTTKAKGEGTGLGLAISKTIVERHKGRIEVETQPGRTCFRVCIPQDLSDKDVAMQVTVDAE